MNTVIRNYITLLKQKLTEISTRIREGGEIINTRIENTGECLYIILENDLRDRGNPKLELEFTSIKSKLPEYLANIVEDLEKDKKLEHENPIGQGVFTAFVALMNQVIGQGRNNR